MNSPAPLSQLHIPAWVLVALKLGLVLLGVALEATHHLSAPIAALLVTALASLGVRGVAQLFAPAQATDLGSLWAQMAPVWSALVASLSTPTPSRSDASDPPDAAPATRDASGAGGRSSATQAFPAAVALVPVLVLALLGFGSSGCSRTPTFPPSTLPDLGAAIACLGEQIAEGQQDPINAGLTCGLQEGALAVDLWKALTGDASASAPAQQAVAAARAAGTVQ